MSKRHFEVGIDRDSNCLLVTDLESENGTWLVILNYLENPISLEVEYQNELIGSFKFSLGPLCFDLQEIMEMFNQPEVLSDLYLLGLNTISDIKEIKSFELESRITKAKIPPDRVDKINSIVKKILADFKDDNPTFRSFCKHKLIFRVETGQFKGMTIEVGYRGTKIGLVETLNKKFIAFSSFGSSTFFDETLFDINFKNGLYYLKAYSNSRIFKKFVSQEKNKILPGHRICAGSQIFTMLQYSYVVIFRHIHFSIGDTESILFEEFSSISDVVNISIYAIIQG